MTFQAKEGACAFAWRNYLLFHSGVSEDDYRRSAFHRYLTDLSDAGDFDFDLLQIAAVSYLKGLAELHDDRGARLAADQAVARRVHSRAPPAAMIVRAIDQEAAHAHLDISPKVIFCRRFTGRLPLA